MSNIPHYCHSMSHDCSFVKYLLPLLWRHNGHNGVSNHDHRIVHSTIHSGAGLRKHQSSASLGFVWEFTGDRYFNVTWMKWNIYPHRFYLTKVNVVGGVLQVAPVHPVHPSIRPSVSSLDSPRMLCTFIHIFDINFKFVKIPPDILGCCTRFIYMRL